jgi:hypothetical protein
MLITLQLAKGCADTHMLLKTKDQVINNLERKLKIITAEQANMNILYYTACGTKLHTDYKCQHIIDRDKSIMHIGDDIYAFLLKANVVCKC